MNNTQTLFHLVNNTSIVVYNIKLKSEKMFQMYFYVVYSVAKLSPINLSMLFSTQWFTYTLHQLVVAIQFKSYMVDRLCANGC